MSQELLYTSAPRGLKPGSSGFCTVVSTQGMAVNLADRLESLSGYRHVYQPQDSNAHRNPVVYSHLQLTVGRQPYHVLSRIAAAGVDYTQRTNKIAHHLVLEPAELPPAGPAWILLPEQGLMNAQWDGQPRVLPGGRRVPLVDSPPAICHAWQQMAGDAGWAGVLAAAAIAEPARQTVLIFRPGQDLLPLIAESLALLPPHLRWKTTFSTYFTKLPVGVECQWRCLLEGSAELASLRRTSQLLVLDLRSPLGPAPERPLVDAARTGVVPAAVAPGSKPGQTVKAFQASDDELEKLLPPSVFESATQRDASSTESPVYGVRVTLPPVALPLDAPPIQGVSGKTFRRKKSRPGLVIGLGAAILLFAVVPAAVYLWMDRERAVLEEATKNPPPPPASAEAQTIKTSETPEDSSQQSKKPDGQTAAKAPSEKLPPSPATAKTDRQQQTGSSGTSQEAIKAKPRPQWRDNYDDTDKALEKLQKLLPTRPLPMKEITEVLNAAYRAKDVAHKLRDSLKDCRPDERVDNVMPSHANELAAKVEKQFIHTRQRCALMSLPEDISIPEPPVKDEHIPGGPAVSQLTTLGFPSAPDSRLDWSILKECTVTWIPCTLAKEKSQWQMSGSKLQIDCTLRLQATPPVEYRIASLDVGASGLVFTWYRDQCLNSQLHEELNQLRYSVIKIAPPGTSQLPFRVLQLHSPCREPAVFTEVMSPRKGNKSTYEYRTIPYPRLASNPSATRPIHLEIRKLYVKDQNGVKPIGWRAQTEFGAHKITVWPKGSAEATGTMNTTSNEEINAEFICKLPSQQSPSQRNGLALQLTYAGVKVRSRDFPEKSAAVLNKRFDKSYKFLKEQREQQKSKEHAARMKGKGAQEDKTAIDASYNDLWSLLDAINSGELAIACEISIDTGQQEKLFLIKAPQDDPTPEKKAESGAKEPAAPAK